MDFKTVYVASNCNQTPTAADCNSDDLIAYASSHAVLIYDPHSGSGGRVTHTLIGHTKRVNSVRWIRGAVHQLVSGATDGTLKSEMYFIICASATNFEQSNLKYWRESDCGLIKSSIKESDIENN